MLQTVAPIVEMDLLPGNYVRLVFENAEFAKESKAGQFLTVRTSDHDTPLLRRPFGIHDVDGDRVAILFKTLGHGTRQLAQKKEGDSVDVLGPLGTGFSLPDDPTQIILVAGGIGIAPLLITARKALEQKHDVRLFFGGATKNDLPSLDVFKKLGIETIVTTEDGSAGQKGLITKPLIDHLESIKDQAKQILTCGPWPMLKAVAKIADKYGIANQASLETIMACGVGSCMGCVTEIHREHSKGPLYQRVCHEGPVFDSKEIDWRKEP